jgi:hypothetical protein
VDAEVDAALAFSSSASDSEANRRGTRGRTVPSFAIVAPFSSSHTNVNAIR